MIASAISEFGNSVEPDQFFAYCRQIEIEISLLQRLLKEHDVELDTSDLESLGRSFLDEPRDVARAAKLDHECRRLIEVLGGTDAH